VSSDAADVAQRAVTHGGADALAHVTHERSLVLRFAASRPTQATAVDDLTVEIAVLVQGHVGRSATNRVDDEALAACAQRAKLAAVAAESAGRQGSYPGFPVPRPGRAHEGHDPATAALDPAGGGSALAAAFVAASAHGLEAHGVWSAGDVETAVASAGEIAVDRVTDAFMKVICIDPRTGRSGYAAQSGVEVAALDPAAIAERAARKVVATHGEPAALAPGEYPVVLEPSAVGVLLDELGGIAFNGLAHVEERGALAGLLETRVAAPAVNLSDSPRFATTLPRAIDAEGVPKAPLPLIQDGIAHRVTHDTRSAALAGAESTGHALAPGGSPSGPSPTNLVLAGGGAADERELCQPIERGIYVTRLWYANVVRPKETLVTAVTRDGTFLIEDGEITRPLADLRLTDSVLGALGRVQALTRSQRLANEGEFYGRRFAYGVVCPALRLGALRFTDAAG
jgi:predicted Zn-dependent protease